MLLPKALILEIRSIVRFGDKFTWDLRETFGSEAPRLVMPSETSSRDGTLSACFCFLQRNSDKAAFWESNTGEDLVGSFFRNSGSQRILKGTKVFSASKPFELRLFSVMQKLEWSISKRKNRKKEED